MLRRHAIEKGERGHILPLATAIVGAGLLRITLSVPRRLIAGRVSLGVEYDMRNRLYGPGFQNFDLTIQRQIRMGRTGVTLRWDIFNVFNTVNFGLPNKDLSTAATFGTISGLASDPRTMQIAVRFVF